MSAAAAIALGALAAVLAAVAGYFAAQVRAAREIARWRDEARRLGAALDTERRVGEERANAYEEARKRLNETFSALSAQALKSNNEEFLKLARENLKQLHIQSQNELSQREKAIESLVKPIKEALEKTEKQIQQMEHARKEAYGSLSQHLKHVAETQQQLQTETRHLVQALRRPEVRGQWGQLTLRRLVELAGMVEHCDFYEEEHRPGEEGALRPDMIVRMPDGREIVVDVKTPLDAYLSATEAVDDAERDKHLLRHARNVRERVRELASKAYWTQFKQAPDFVVLFIPGEQFLSAALDQDPELLENALRQKVIIATPTSLIALLRAVAFGWRQQSVAENAERIRELGEQLYQRIATFTEHLARVGKSLDASVDHYNRAVGSLERQVLPSARRFTEMGLDSKKQVESLEPLERVTRTPQTEKGEGSGG